MTLTLFWGAFKWPGDVCGVAIHIKVMALLATYFLGNQRIQTQGNEIKLC